jgi:RNA polymerase sigma-70 factor (ECF subfamily)
LQGRSNLVTLFFRNSKEGVRIVPNGRSETEGQIPDYELIGRVGGGDETALAILYDRYAGIVYSLAIRVLNDVGAAEEVLQDIFHQLWRTASNFDRERGTLAGWLLVMARSRAVDRLRRRQKGKEKALQENLVPCALDLESSVAREELVRKVKAVLAALPGPQRQALELAYFEGLTHSEIAARTREPLGTIKTRLRSALQALRKTLNP